MVHTLDRQLTTQTFHLLSSISPPGVNRETVRYMTFRCDGLAHCPGLTLACTTGLSKNGMFCTYLLHGRILLRFSSQPAAPHHHGIFYRADSPHSPTICPGR